MPPRKRTVRRIMKSLFCTYIPLANSLPPRRVAPLEGARVLLDCPYPSAGPLKGGDPTRVVAKRDVYTALHMEKEALDAPITTSYQFLPCCPVGLSHAQFPYSALDTRESSPGSHSSLPGRRRSTVHARARDPLWHQPREPLDTVLAIPGEPVTWRSGPLDHILPNLGLAGYRGRSSLDAWPGGPLCGHQRRPGHLAWHHSCLEARFHAGYSCATIADVSTCYSLLLAGFTTPLSAGIYPELVP